MTDATIARWLRLARRRLPPHHGTVDVAAVGPTTMRQLNRQWRGHDRPTNVLSFQLDQSFPSKESNGVWGQLILCPAVIRREAPTWQRTYRQHVRALIEHGLLHLYGLDHERPAERRRWQRYARRLSPS